MAPPRTEETRESWYGVQDARKRKQIQDRLAHRARRKRLAEESKKEQERAIVVASEPSKRFRAIAPSDSCSGTSPSTAPISPTCRPTSALAAPTTDLVTTPNGPPLSPATISSSTQTPVPLPVDQQLLVKPNRTAFIAFAELGHRMGINWVCVGLVRSWRQPPDLPENMQPTPLQLTTPHPVWIDRLPFPRMRDNVILLADTIDMAQFYVDLTLNESFEVKEDMPPHDPAAYRMVPQFRERWGYLFR